MKVFGFGGRSIKKLMKKRESKLSLDEARVRQKIERAVDSHKSFEESGRPHVLGMHGVLPTQVSLEEHTAFQYGRQAVLEMLLWLSQNKSKPLTLGHFNECGNFARRNFHPQVGAFWARTFSLETEDSEIPIANKLRQELPQLLEEEQGRRIEEGIAWQLDVPTDEVRSLPFTTVVKGRIPSPQTPRSLPATSWLAKFKELFKRKKKP